MAEEIVRVLRLVEYIGPREWVEETVAKSLHGEKRMGTNGECRIRGVTISEFPEVLPIVVSVPAPN